MFQLTPKLDRYCPKISMDAELEIEGFLKIFTLLIRSVFRSLPLSSRTGFVRSIDLSSKLDTSTVSTFSSQ